MKTQVNRIKVFSKLLDAEPVNMEQIDNQVDLLDESMRALRVAVRSGAPISVRLALADSFIFSVQLAWLTGGLKQQECWATPCMRQGMEIFSFIQSHNIYRTNFNSCINDLIYWMHGFAKELKINLSSI